MKKSINKTDLVIDIKNKLNIEKVYEEFTNTFEITEKTPDYIKKLFKKLKEYNIPNNSFWDLEVIDIEKDKKFKFSEYDGAEYIEYYNELEWFIVN